MIIKYRESFNRDLKKIKEKKYSKELEIRSKKYRFQKIFHRLLD